MTDVLPRRNLGLAENWGRNVEGRLAEVTKKFGTEIQNLHGLSRYSASSAEEFTRNARRIEDALLAMPYYFTNGTSVAAPNVTTSWSTIASLSIPVPIGKPHLEILATVNSTLPYPGGSSTTQFIWPFSLELVTSEYGVRPGGFHEGMDFAGGAASSGNPIPAAGAGVVAESVTGHPGWGNYVRLEHDVGGTIMSTLYAHMIASPSVSVSDVVTIGQTLGFVGNTGNSFGAHLHFETWGSDTYGSHGDPRQFMFLFGSTSTATSPPLLRIVIDGFSSIPFSGLLSTTTPVMLTYIPIHGRSYTPAGPDVTVSLEAISGGAVTGEPTTLAVTGAFRV